jgi:hypothetical protein
MEPILILIVAAGVICLAYIIINWLTKVVRY